MIKNVAILFLLLGAVYGRQLNLKINNIEPYILEDVINSTIEGIRDSLPEPLKVDNFDLSFPDEEDSIISGSANIANLVVTGLHDFQVPALNLAIVGMRLNLTFVIPSLIINADYKGDLSVLHLVPIYGNGKANFRLTDLQIVISAQADLTNGISVKGLRLQISIGDATFDIHGALNNEDFSAILSQVLNDAVVSLIDNHQEAITTILSPVIEDIINTVLAGADTNTTPSTL